MKPLVVFLMGALLVSSGCGKGKTRVVKRAGEPDIVNVSGKDPKMTAAIDKARATVSTFVQALKAATPAQSSFSVKMKFSDGTNTEHMWLDRVTFDGKQFHGVVNNAPNRLTNVRLGDRASVESKNISDWMYVQNNRLVGGYTIRALRESVPAKDRAAFDESLPFTID